MNKRDFLKLTSSTALLSSFPVCSLFAKEGSHDLYQYLLESAKKLATSGKETLTVLYPEGAIDNILPVANEFTKATNIQVTFKSTPIDDITTAISLNKLSGDYKFDIALPPTFSVPDLAEVNALLDLTDYAKKYEVKGFEPSLFTSGDVYKKRKYGYQTDGDVYMMFYNNLLLGNKDYQKEFEDKFGEKITVPKNWQEIDRLIAFFHKPDQDIYGGNLFRTENYMIWEWWARYHATGNTVFDHDFNQNITNDAAISALDDLLSVSQYLSPGAKSDGLFENWEAFAKGNIAVNIGWGGTQKYLNQYHSKVKDNLLFSATPNFSYFNWGWNYIVCPASPHPELAYIFCLFATLPKQSVRAIRAKDGFFDPFRPCHYDDSVVQDVYTKPFLKAHRKAMEQAKPDFYMQGHAEYMKALKENIMYAFEGTVSSKEALELAALEWESITKKIGKRGQQEQWRNLSK